MRYRDELYHAWYRVPYDKVGANGDAEKKDEKSRSREVGKSAKPIPRRRVDTRWNIAEMAKPLDPESPQTDQSALVQS